jgi:hypothetical protein
VRTIPGLSEGVEVAAWRRTEDGDFVPSSTGTDFYRCNIGGSDEKRLIVRPVKGYEFKLIPNSFYAYTIEKIPAKWEPYTQANFLLNWKIGVSYGIDRDGYREFFYKTYDAKAPEFPDLDTGYRAAIQAIADKRNEAEGLL